MGFDSSFDILLNIESKLSSQERIKITMNLFRPGSSLMFEITRMEIGRANVCKERKMSLIVSVGISCNFYLEVRNGMIDADWLTHSALFI